MIIPQNEVSPGLIRPKEYTDQNISKAHENSRCDAKRGQKLQRRSSIPPPDNQPARDKSTELPNPTMEEMEQVLSDEEMKSYLDHWRAGKEYSRSLYAIKRGYRLSNEEEMQLNANKRSYNKARRLERYVQSELVRSNRARPEMVESYKKRNRDMGMRAKNMRKRRDELEFLVDNNMASPDEVEEYEKVLEGFQHMNRVKRQSEAKKEMADKERMKELESRINKGVATDDERAEYENLAVKRGKQLEQRKEANKRWRAKKKAGNERIEELEGLINKDVATDDERAEYQDKIANHQKEREKHNEASRNWLTKKKIAEKERIERLEGLIKKGVATDNERAEYQDMIAKRQKKREKQNEASRNWLTKKRIAEKERIERLEGLIKKGIATDNDRAEYKQIIAEIERGRELKAQKNKSYRDKKKGERAGTPITEKGSGRADQTSVDQPLQSSSNLLLYKIEPSLDRLGKLWKAASQVRNSPWAIPLDAGLARPMPVPFGVIP